MTTDDMGLRFVDKLKVKWRLPDDPVAGALLIPALRQAETFDCMVGYFGEGALRELAPGLATFALRESAPMRLLISPVLSGSVQEALELGTTFSAEDIEGIIGYALDRESQLGDALVDHTLECLAYLLAKGRLEIKVVLLPRGIFHLKEWILSAGEDSILLSGSANFTGGAISHNVESLYLHRSWRDTDNYETCLEAQEEFDRYWEGKKEIARIYDIPQAINLDILTKFGGPQPPMELVQFDSSSEINDDQGTKSPAFAIPAHLDLFHGPYAHQGEAIRAWEANDRRGVLALATGAGKTITALAAAKRIAERGPLLIVIAVPTNPLLEQWDGECRSFGLSPLRPSNVSSRNRKRAIFELLDDLDWGVSSVGCLLLTNDALLSEEVLGPLAEASIPLMLISDEVHNLGGFRGFKENRPELFQYRLGLSATPIRQYDEEGTDALLSFFKGVVFEFGLEDAIGVCLVPYDYHIHRVPLEPSELEQYAELSEKIRKAFLRSVSEQESVNSYLTVLLNRRRLVLETAEGKLGELERLIARGPTPSRTLIYATDKDPRQLGAVNAMLSKRRIRFHQITDRETSSGRLVGRVLQAFSEGTLQVLTAKRVLDEGLNVPQIDTAYILASTTVKKQWVQRRGRVLRPSPATGKSHAVIHDFVVVPPPEHSSDPDARRMVQSELERCEEFSSLARNRAALDGPFSVINDIRYEFLT